MIMNMRFKDINFIPFSNIYLSNFGVVTTYKTYSDMNLAEDELLW